MGIDWNKVDLSKEIASEVTADDLMERLDEVLAQVKKLTAQTGVTPAVMDEHAAAAYIGSSVYWLRNNRRSSRTPPFLKVGKNVRYSRASLDTWLMQQEVKH